MKNDKGEWIYRVYDEIEAAFAKQLKPAQLAFLSGFSYYHFHRLFQRVTGESVKQYLNRLIAERAAYELKTAATPVLEIAFAAGFASNEAFTRAFKKIFHLSPRAYREKFARKTSRLTVTHTALSGAAPVILRVDSFRIAYLRRLGSYTDFPGPLPDSREVAALVALALSPALQRSKWVGISNDDPEITPPEKIRFDLGLTLPDRFRPPEKFGVRVIRGGLFLRARHRGPYTDLPAAYDFLLGAYADGRRLKIRNLPPFEVYLNPLADGEKLTDIYIPLRK